MWAVADQLVAQQALIRKAAEHKEAAALLAEGRCAELRQELSKLDEQVGLARWRSRTRREECRELLHQETQSADEERQAAATARATAETHCADIERRLTPLIAGIPFSRERIRELERALRDARAAKTLAKELEPPCRDRAGRSGQRVRRAREAEELTAHAERRDWPAQHGRAERLRPQAAADTRRRPELEERFKEVQEEYERLARNAQGEIIRGARLVATTLARFRTNKAVFEGPYDVALVDEAGSATLPEVLLATAKASRTAVLLGDFMQLGPIIEAKLKELRRPDVKRWLLPDVFQHCGITAPQDAQRHPACVTLVEQHRFGPAVMQLANELAYGGVLLGGSQTRTPRHADDAEIVLVDTDGLGELATAHLTGARKGWWTGGALLARALVELHREQGEEAGIVTPYGVQAEATLEALRDVEGAGQPLAEVGTAHRFQGREFPVVVFDTVEGSLGRELWMACAHGGPGAGDWERSGVRLFNVAATRVQHRLYVIAGGERVKSAKPGTPFAHLAAMLDAKTPGVRVLHARQLITPPHADDRNLGGFGTKLAEVLSRHVEVTDIQDEREFYRTFQQHLGDADTSIWLWAPWVANRVRGILPDLRDAVARGVRVTVFIRDDTDQLQGRAQAQALIADLRAVVHTVVPVNVMHQKIVVIDERTVLLGSLNSLSQSRTREVMLTMHGAYFARKLLEQQHAETFARPPKCGRCGGSSIELRRRTNGTWFWRCYDTTCKSTPTGRSNAWNLDIRFGGGRGRQP
jgi:hypothetical protein